MEEKEAIFDVLSECISIPPQKPAIAGCLSDIMSGSRSCGLPTAAVVEAQRGAYWLLSPSLPLMNGRKGRVTSWFPFLQENRSVISVSKKDPCMTCSHRCCRPDTLWVLRYLWDSLIKGSHLDDCCAFTP